jgi:glycolate oxidase FAD binding subunit
LLIDGLSDAQALAAMSAALGSPFEVSGAAHVPVGPDGGPVTILRLEGFAASVTYRCARLSDLLALYGAARIEDDPVQVSKTWAWVRDVEGFANAPGDVWWVSVKPSDAPAVAARIGAQVIYDWGGGLIWALVPEGTDLRARIGAFGGHATLVRASAETRTRLPVFQPEAPGLAALAQGLRRQFDPRGILNPGFMS